MLVGFFANSLNQSFLNYDQLRAVMCSNIALTTRTGASPGDGDVAVESPRTIEYYRYGGFHKWEYPKMDLVGGLNPSEKY